MKTIFGFFAAVISVTLLFTGAVLADETHYRVDVEGMNCPFCAYGIEKKLKRLDGVEQVEVDLTHGQFWLKVDDAITMSEETVSTIVRDAGFTFKGLTRHDEPHSQSDDSE
ncbi:MAG: heavy-metal-associated domain-containing protein [Gammaproteobacteria bacterium]|nr:heavy-metal-associated domain-containing protein [Gammaproteobacteria bacterium]